LTAKLYRIAELCRLYSIPEHAGKQHIGAAMKSTADLSHFDALDIRVGRITKVEDAATKKPTYRLTIDFGGEIGSKVSCGAYRNYAPDELLGKQIIGVINFAEKKMGPELSQVLVLGVPNDKGETVYLTPESDVSLGVKVF
jgi:tRNA-binding protein